MSRKTISSKTQVNILTKCRRRCAFCTFLDKNFDIQKGQLAHIDRDSSNSDESNLAYLCQKHHDEYDTINSQTKKIQTGELITAKSELEKYIKEHFSENLVAVELSSEKLDLPDNTESVTNSVYNLRLPIYEEVDNFLSIILRETKISQKELFTFATNTHYALFLCGKEIDKYCRSLYLKGVDLWGLQRKLEKTPQSNDQWSELIEKETDLILWFSDQFKVRKQIFYPYLKLGNQ